MRPVIAISDAFHGPIKDYAEANDPSLDEAYVVALETGLDTLETQDK
ncbi:hypothetical protein [Natrinema sp. 1APR25-10V2]|nr:hypothetical protein [Natrinema sp. 1APR25-10V2]MDS0475472.1 hypothetical protein [Natrinema sp. 1APR25-10V2]